MRAWIYRIRGPPSTVLKLETNIAPPPPPTKDNLLIKISHSALTPSMAILMNMVPSLPFLSRPYTPELDFSGIISQAGPSAPENLKPGTHVFGSIPLLPNYLLYGAGSMAEYALVPANFMAQVPEAEGFGLAEAAALNGNGQTAALMIKNAGMEEGKGKGKRVFVNGGSGGVGTLVVQVAKAEGAYVVATGSGDSADLVKRLGADEVIDYRVHAPLHEYLAKNYGSEPFDAILDTVGTQLIFEHSPAYLKSDGKFINVGAMEGLLKYLWSMMKNILWPRLLGGTPRSYKFQQTNPDQKSMSYLVRLVEEKKLTVVVDRVFEMEDALQAYDRILSQRAKGKVVVKIQDV